LIKELRIFSFSDREKKIGNQSPSPMAPKSRFDMIPSARAKTTDTCFEILSSRIWKQMNRIHTPA